MKCIWEIPSKVKSTYRKLMERANWIAEVVREALVILHRASCGGSISVLKRVFNLGCCRASRYPKVQ